MNDSSSPANPGKLVDSIDLAYGTMLWCRYGGPESSEYLQQLVDVLQQVQAQGCLVVEMPSEWMTSAKVPMFETFVRENTSRRYPTSELPADKRYLLAILEYAAHEMLTLCKAGSIRTIHSLGYAFHPLCELVRKDEPVDPRLFRFNFRIAAAHWSELSQDMRQSLCDLAGYTVDDAERLLMEKGFVIAAKSNE
ncbi:MAG TPA: hypothetical protein PKA58_12495 [Polyangium sp.]|nr:hypothetical protein [Polyangium sp.]